MNIKKPAFWAGQVFREDESSSFYARSCLPCFLEIRCILINSFVPNSKTRGKYTKTGFPRQERFGGCAWDPKYWFEFFHRAERDAKRGGFGWVRMGSNHGPRSYQERALPLSHAPPSTPYFTICFANGQDLLTTKISEIRVASFCLPFVLQMAKINYPQKNHPISEAWSGL